MTATAHKPPKPPVHLSREAKRWWSGVMTDYEIEPHMVSIVTAAAEAMDRKEAARKVLAAEGMVTPCRGGLKTHPLIAVERDSRLAFLRAVRELCLSEEDPAENRVHGLRYPGRRY